MKNSRLYGAFDVMGRRIGLVAVAALVLVMALGIVGPMVANTDDANFDPEGEVFTTLEVADQTLRSDTTITSEMFLIEASEQGANVLTPEAFREWKTLSNRVRTNPENTRHLVPVYDIDAGSSLPSLYSIVDAVDLALGDTGISGATDAEIIQAIDSVLSDGSGTEHLRYTLSEGTKAPTAGLDSWTSPAFTASITFDEGGFDGRSDAEKWLRTVQEDLRAGAVHTSAIGVAIDADLAFEEAAAQSAPFIFLAVGLIILLVAVVHRSYWSAAVVGVGLAGTTLAYYGTAALLGLKMGSLLLAFIVPIAMISFGVDFYIHGVGRVREMQVDGAMSVRRAYPAGMTAVFTAMLLALSSSVAAFMANAASGIEAIIQFGIGAAISLAWAFLLLGLIAPRITVGLEDRVGPNPAKRFSKPFYALGAFLMAVVGGLMVALGAVMPTIGVAALAIFLALFVAAPVAVTRRRNRRAAFAGRRMARSHTGSAHGLRPVGTMVGFLARWKAVTIPIVIVIAVLGLARASQVESGFEIKDFISSDTDFAQSIEKVTGHFPSTGEGSSFIYINGDLTNPATLEAISEIRNQLSSTEAQFGVNADGELLVRHHAADAVRMTMASPQVARELGLVDADGNGLPDTAQGIATVYEYIWANGVPTVDGGVAIEAIDVPAIVAPTDNGQATAFVIQVGSYTDGTIIVPVRTALEDAAATLAASTGVSAVVSGDVIAEFMGMEAFTRSMLVSLPLAALLTFLIASVMLRSVRYALVSVIPIGLVVTGVYAFMASTGYTVNVVTATIAAIAVGVGIDFSTHFAVRFREELAVDGSRLDAVRRAGTGTGGALVLSALTSVLGFTVMAIAPTPIFATFGLLTAVMIVLSLAVALLVLPSLLVLATKDHAPEAVVEPTPEPALIG